MPYLTEDKKGTAEELEEW